MTEEKENRSKQFFLALSYCCRTKSGFKADNLQLREVGDEWGGSGEWDGVSVVSFTHGWKG